MADTPYDTVLGSIYIRAYYLDCPLKPLIYFDPRSPAQGLICRSPIQTLRKDCGTTPTFLFHWPRTGYASVRNFSSSAKPLALSRPTPSRDGTPKVYVHSRTRLSTDRLAYPHLNCLWIRFFSTPRGNSQISGGPSEILTRCVSGRSGPVSETKRTRSDGCVTVFRLYWR